MIQRCCSTCGQTLPDGDVPVELKGKKREVYLAVKRAGPHGIDTKRLFDTLYRDDPNGGPIVGERIISIFVCHLNKKLKAVNQKVQGGRTGNGVFASYKLVTLS